MTISETTTPNTRRWLAAILFIALALRCWHITSPLYDLNYWRQTETAALAMNYHQDDLPFIYPEIDWFGPDGRAEMEFPLFPYLVAQAYGLVGAWDGLGRMLSILCALVSIGAVYSLGRRLADEWTGLFAAAVFSAAPLTIYFGRTFQPDMMMMACALSSLAFLLAWNACWSDWRLYLSGLLFSVAIGLKPTALVYAPFIASVFVWRLGWTGPLNPKALIFGVIALALPAAWYWHAHQIYRETGATFIRHYIDFSFQSAFFRFWFDPAYWPIVALRTGVESLVYIGVALAALGLWAVWAPASRRWLCLAFLLAAPALYLGVPGHHYGHHYYSLPAVAPLALLAGAGLRWLGAKCSHRVAPGLWMLIPLGMAAYAMVYMERGQWYNQLYIYYQDAVDLRDELPDAPVAVFDELYHTPEFFYFADCVGWHRMRNAGDWVDDSQWIEQMRHRGAAALVCLNESYGNHPIKHLLNHPTGQHILTHYALQEIGFRHFVARYDQPVYGDHFLKQLDGKRVAMPFSNHDRYSSLSALDWGDWREADALFIDFHGMPVSERDMVRDVYDSAVDEGFAVVAQNGGRMILEPSDDIRSASHALDAAVVGHWLPGQDQYDRISFGMVDAGRYRVSVEFEDADLKPPIRLHAITPDGVIRSHRDLQEEHIRLIEEGDRPTLLLNLPAPVGIHVGASQGDKALKMRSAVLLPDLECVKPDMVFQAESLMLNQAEVTGDPDADRGEAVWGYAVDQGRFICHGPFIQLPSGVYEAGFRLRTPREWSQWDVVVGLHENDKVWQRIVPFTTQLLPTEYTELTVEAYIPESYVIETRAWLYEDSEVMLDTIRLSQVMRDSVQWATQPAVAEFKIEDSTRAISATGVISDVSGGYVKKLNFLEGGAAAADYHPNTGLRVLDPMGRIFDEDNVMVWYAPWTKREPIAIYSISNDGSADGYVAADGMVYLHQDGEANAFSIETRPYRVRELHVYSNQSAHVLFGNGFVASIGDAPAIRQTPDFQADAARALVSTPEGHYIVDSRGGIHSCDGAPKVNTPHYRLEDWIVGAEHSPDGEWTFITRTGERLSFRP